MVQIEKSLDGEQNSGMGAGIDYVMLDEANLPTLASKGLLPDGLLQPLVKRVSKDRYESKRKERIDDCKRQLMRGDKCIVGMLGDKAVGWIWIFNQSEKYEPALETNIPIDPNSSIIYRWLVYPPFRNRGYGTLLLDHALFVLNQQNVSKAVMVVENDNRPSLKATKRLGFEATRSIKRVRFFGYSTLSVNQLNDLPD